MKYLKELSATKFIYSLFSTNISKSDRGKKSCNFCWFRFNRLLLADRSLSANSDDAIHFASRNIFSVMLMKWLKSRVKGHDFFSYETFPMTDHNIYALTSISVGFFQEFNRLTKVNNSLIQTIHFPFGTFFFYFLFFLQTIPVKHGKKIFWIKARCFVETNSDTWCMPTFISTTTKK